MLKRVVLPHLYGYYWYLYDIMDKNFGFFDENKVQKNRIDLKQIVFTVISDQW